MRTFAGVVSTRIRSEMFLALPNAPIPERMQAMRSPTRSSGEAASARERSQAARQRELERKAAEADQIRAAVPSILEMLEAWLTFYRKSPLDGTISCKLCAAMVLEENSERHASWHNEHKRQHQGLYGEVPG